MPSSAPSAMSAKVGTAIRGCGLVRRAKNVPNATTTMNTGANALIPASVAASRTAGLDGVASGCRWLAAEASVIVSVVEPVVPAPVRLIATDAPHVAPEGRPVQVSVATLPVKAPRADASIVTVPVLLPDGIVIDGVPAASVKLGVPMAA